MLREYIDGLRARGELVSITRHVSTIFEIAALTARFDGKEALLFEHVKNEKWKKEKEVGAGKGASERSDSIGRVVSNLCGTRRRFAYALGCDEQGIHGAIAKAVNSPLKPSMGEILAGNTTRTLDVLPIVMHFEKDAGPFITSSIVFARDEENARQNASVHRFLYLDESHMAVRMVEGRHLHKCYQYAKEHGEDLKVSIAIGVHPAVLIAAAYQADHSVDELHIANSLLNDRLKVSMTGNGLLVPSHAEIILEGRMLKDVYAEEWMVEMLRTYDHRRKQPVFELDVLRYRDHAIYHDILAGYSEHRLLMGMPVEAKILNMVKGVVPTTRQVVLTDGGCNWLHAVIQIRKRLEGEAKNALIAAFAAHPSLKLAVVVDDDIDPNDPKAVEYALATRFQADRGLIVIRDAKGSSLDPSSDQEHLLTSKLGIDATASLLKDRSRFEVARIPMIDDIRVEDYL
ncbi:MAG: UbiD family decarboxylase [Candidatus Nitrosocaldus sp.]|nr:UbiD family decarboxylase [Candidatus Nitrosocaldus sp.]